MKLSKLVVLTLILFPLIKYDLAVSQNRIVSPNYEIQMPGFNSGAGLPESDNYSASVTLGKINGDLSSTGYQVKAGFQYINTIIPFSFTLSSFEVDFGTLTPNVFSTKSATITVKAGGAGGYRVTAHESHPLQDSLNNTIQDTPCDTACSEITAGSWTDTSKTGFGYNIQGDDIPADFSTTNHFRQFADISSGESPQRDLTIIRADI